MENSLQILNCQFFFENVISLVSREKRVYVQLGLQDLCYLTVAMSEKLHSEVLGVLEGPTTGELSI
jgi:hypothetical protein